MSVDLPEPIAAYIAAENRHDTEAVARCFADHAVVRDEGRTIEGLTAIKQWKAETKKKYHHTVLPLEVVCRHDKTVLTATLTGDFPGSPVTVNFDFVLEAGKILSLEIHA